MSTEMVVEFFKVKGLENIDSARDEIARKYLDMQPNNYVYQLMTPNLENIFKCICPVKTNINNYTVNAIPTIVLEEISKIKSDYQRIEIWYDDKQKDPICVAISPSIKIDDENGRLQNKYGSFKTNEDALKFIEDNNLIGHKPYDYSSSADKYLIARWGDEIEPMSILSEKAKKRYLMQQKRHLMEQKLDAEKRLAMLDLECDEKFYI